MYGAAQSFPLPISGFGWIDPQDFRIFEQSWESWTGYEVRFNSILFYLNSIINLTTLFSGLWIYFGGKFMIM